MLMKSLARRDALSNILVNKLDDASVPKPGSLSIKRVQTLLSIRPHKKGSNHLQANHITNFKGNNKLRHRVNRILGTIRDGKQIRIMLEDMEEQIREILYVILTSNEAIMLRNVHIEICIVKVSLLIRKSKWSNLM